VQINIERRFLFIYLSFNPIQVENWDSTEIMRTKALRILKGITKMTSYPRPSPSFYVFLFLSSVLCLILVHEADFSLESRVSLAPDCVDQTSDFHDTEYLAVLTALSAKAEDHCATALWGHIYEKTYVDLLFATHDRPKELREALSSVHVFVMDISRGVSIIVLYSASSDLFLSAYNQVKVEYPGVFFVEKDTASYFSTLRETISGSKATNFVITSDDNIFFRTAELRKLATLQNILQQDAEDDVTYSVQLRVSSRDLRPELIAELLPTWGLPHVHITNCSRSLQRSEPAYTTFVAVCYDRGIDSPMFTKQIIEDEFRTLATLGNASNPGILEGIWIEWSYHKDGKDYAIFPIDRVVANTGMGMATVRTDRQFNLTAIPEEDDIRIVNAQNLLQGCKVKHHILGELQAIDSMQNTGDLWAWECSTP